MRSSRLLPLVLAAALPLSQSRAADAPAVATPPLAALAWLPGGVWRAELPGEKGAPPTTIELRFAWADNGHALRFDTTFAQGDKRAPTYSGMYAWNGAAKKFVIFYTDRGGGLVEGPVAAEGDTLVHELTITGADGKVESARVRLTRTGADAFTNTIYLPKDGGWDKFIEVHYARR